MCSEREKCCTNLTEHSIAFKICTELVVKVWIRSSSSRTSFCLLLAGLHSTLLPFLWSVKTKRVWAFRECLFCDTFDLCIPWSLAICFIHVGWTKRTSERCDTFMKNARTLKMCVLCVCFDVFFKNPAAHSISRKTRQMNVKKVHLLLDINFSTSPKLCSCHFTYLKCKLLCLKNYDKFWTRKSWSFLESCHRFKLILFSYQHW